MSAPTVTELNEALSYVDRSHTILKNLITPQISALLAQSEAIQFLFRAKQFRLRLRLFISVEELVSELTLLAWLGEFFWALNNFFSQKTYLRDEILTTHGMDQCVT